MLQQILLHQVIEGSILQLQFLKGRAMGLQAIAPPGEVHADAHQGQQVDREHEGVQRAEGGP